MSIINERIKERRLQLNLTLADVADAIGVKEATAQRYESGAIKNISHETICNLSRVLRCSPSYLMGWESSAPAAGYYTDLEKSIIMRFRSLSIAEKNLVLRSLGLSELSDSKKESCVVPEVG